ncbi:MAG: inorganic phosphate transporter [Chloroflexi bacterium]|nr:inorganic phosphate transporter [Chloroflexota bacterium]
MIVSGFSGAVIPVIALALVFGFLNGFHDSSSMVATVISSRAMPPRQALLLTAAAHLVAPFLFGVAVATTIGHEVVRESAVTLPVIQAGLIAAIFWSVLTWWLGMPSSSSHALIGGIVGSVAIDSGWRALQPNGLLKVLGVLFFAPLFGLVVSYLVMRLVFFLARGASPRINWWFKRAQVLTLLGLSLGHGANDAQKIMAIITMALLADKAIASFHVPLWVVGISASTMMVGASLGGWRLIRTLGMGLYKMQPVHSFTAQVAAALVIIGGVLFGGPVSTTQVVAAAVIGAGSAERTSKVRWGLAGQIVRAWLLTIPATAGIAALIHVVMAHYH